MSASSVGYDRIWAWREGMGDVYADEWAPEGDKDAPMEAEAYILATPEAIAASPEGAALIREAEARRMERMKPVQDAYEELLATVRGECSSLLDPCRGGSDVLSDLIFKAEVAIQERNND